VTVTVTVVSLIADLKCGRSEGFIASGGWARTPSVASERAATQQAMPIGDRGACMGALYCRGRALARFLIETTVNYFALRR
jgi:hypothetical protein